MSGRIRILGQSPQARTVKAILGPIFVHRRIEVVTVNGEEDVEGPQVGYPQSLQCLVDPIAHGCERLHQPFSELEHKGSDVEKYGPVERTPAKDVIEHRTSAKTGKRPIEIDKGFYRLLAMATVTLIDKGGIRDDLAIIPVPRSLQIN